jgi:hypothetical protein
MGERKRCGFPKGYEGKVSDFPPAQEEHTHLYAGKIFHFL